MRRLLREPLLHFAVAGALLFGVNGLVRKGRGNPGRARLDAKALSIARSGSFESSIASSDSRQNA